MPKQAEAVADGGPLDQFSAADSILGLLEEFDPGDGTLATDLREDEGGEPPDDESEDDTQESESEDADESEEDETEEEDEDAEYDEDDEEDEEEDVEASADTYTVTVDGETIEVTLDELRNGYQRQESYTRKTQDLATRRREIESQLDAVGETRKTLLSDLNIAQSFVAELAKPPADDLAEKNPQEYTRQKARYDKAQTQIQHLRAAQNKVVEDAMTEAQTLRAARQKEESEKLLEAVPEWKDTTVAKKEVGELVEFLERQYGFTAEDLAAADDHRVYLMVRDAMAKHTISESAEKIKEKAKPKARKTLPPGTRQPNSGKKGTGGKKNRQLVDRLRRTGSTHDAAELIFNILPDMD